MRINDLERELTASVKTLAPTLLTRPGIAVLTAVKIVGETADITRFKSKDAYARHTGTAPLPLRSGNRTRHRLARAGNRQLNCALRRITITQGRCHPDARAFLERRLARANTRTEALRARQQVRIYVRERHGRYDLTDRAAAVNLAGRPDGQLATASDTAAGVGMKVNRRGVVFVTGFGRRDFADLAMRLAECSRLVYVSLLESTG